MAARRLESARAGSGVYDEILTASARFHLVPATTKRIVPSSVQLALQSPIWRTRLERRHPVDDGSHDGSPTILRDATGTRPT